MVNSELLTAFAFQIGHVNMWVIKLINSFKGNETSNIDLFLCGTTLNFSVPFVHTTLTLKGPSFCPVTECRELNLVDRLD